MHKYTFKFKDNSPELILEGDSITKYLESPWVEIGNSEINMTTRIITLDVISIKKEEIT